jgi:hypothetical protein
MDPRNPIELDNESDSDRLTTLQSGDTPTLDDGESPTIKALMVLPPTPIPGIQYPHI